MWGMQAESRGALEFQSSLAYCSFSLSSRLPSLECHGRACRLRYSASWLAEVKVAARRSRLPVCIVLICVQAKRRGLESSLFLTRSSRSRVCPVSTHEAWKQDKAERKSSGLFYRTYRARICIVGQHTFQTCEERKSCLHSKAISNREAVKSKTTLRDILGSRRSDCFATGWWGTRLQVCAQLLCKTHCQQSCRPNSLLSLICACLG